MPCQSLERSGIPSSKVCHLVSSELCLSATTWPDAVCWQHFLFCKPGINKSGTDWDPAMYVRQCGIFLSLPFPSCPTSFSSPGRDKIFDKTKEGKVQRFCWIITQWQVKLWVEEDSTSLLLEVPSFLWSWETSLHRSLNPRDPWLQRKTVLGKDPFCGLFKLLS